MEITIIGIIIILVSLIILFKDKETLIKLNIFFIPFSATAVINVGSGEAGSSVQPYMYFCILNFMVLVCSLLNNYKFKFYRNEVKLINLLLLFASFAFFSIFSPMLAVKNEIGNQSGSYGEYGLIYFSSKNITQFVYLLLGIIFSLLIYDNASKNENRYISYLKVFGYSLIFTMIWGFFELFCKKTGLLYPDFIFNNTAKIGGQGFSHQLDAEGKYDRITSVAVEASILVQNFLVFLPFLIHDYLYKRYSLFSKKVERFLIILFSVFIFLSTSSSGILSLFVLYFIIFVQFLNRQSAKQRFALFLGITLISVLFIGTVVYLFYDLLNATLFTKGDSYSAIERSAATLSAWKNFKNYPILGVGWGSVTSFDLFIKVFSNTGILGGIPFVILLFELVKKHMFNNKVNNNLDNFYNSAIFCSVLILIFNNGISGFTFMFGHFWFIIGLAIILKFKKKTI